MKRGIIHGLFPLLLPYCALFCAGLALTLAQSLGLFLPLGPGEFSIEHYQTLVRDQGIGQSLGLSLFVAFFRRRAPSWAAPFWPWPCGACLPDCAEWAWCPRSDSSCPTWQWLSWSC